MSISQPVHGNLLQMDRLALQAHFIRVEEEQASMRALLFPPSVAGSPPLPDPPSETTVTAVPPVPSSGYTECFSRAIEGSLPTTATLNQHRPPTHECPEEDMPPPPARVFDDRDAAVSFLLTWPITRGYKLVTQNSADGGDRMIYACWMHPKRTASFGAKAKALQDSSADNVLTPATPDKKTRAGLTRDQNCPFKVGLRKRKVDGRFEIYHICNTHSQHEFCRTLSKLSPRFNKEQRDEIMRRTALGQSRPQIHDALDTADFPSSAFDPKRVTNVIRRARMALAGDYATDVERSLHSLHDRNSPWYYSLRMNEENRLSALFIMHTNARKALQCYWHLLVMDCTYSTNVHGLKLLNIVGKAPTGDTYCVAHCFLSRENESAFTWALRCLKEVLPGGVNPTFAIDRDNAMINALKMVFPDSKRLLCIWHIKKQILQHIYLKIVPHEGQTAEELDHARTRMYDMIETLIGASSADDEDDYWATIQEMANNSPGQRSYVYYFEETWWPHRDMWVAWRTCTSLNYGCRTTSIAESCHARLKHHLRGRNNSLLALKGAFEKLAHEEHKAISSHISKQRMMKPASDKRSPLQQVFLQPLQNKIAWRALEIAGNEIARAEDACRANVGDECINCHIKLIHGVPCRHSFVSLLRVNKLSIDINEFHHSLHLPRQWAEGPRIPDSERVITLRGDRIVDFMMVVQDAVQVLCQRSHHTVRPVNLGGR